MLQHFAYDFGPDSGRFPKSYADSSGRRIVYGWIGGGDNPGGGKAPQPWQGMQTVPRLITPSGASDPTTAMLSRPVPELEQLRGKQLASLRGLELSAGWSSVAGVAGRHLDVLVTFRGLAGAASNAHLNLSVNAFAPHPIALSWRPLATVPATEAGWVSGWVDDSMSRPSLKGAPPGGPLDIRATQDALGVRVLVDGSVLESFWDGGRARQTARVWPAAGCGGLRLSAGVSAGVTADVEVWEMRSSWL